MKEPCVYIMASRRNGTLYVGVTSDLPKRAYKHRTGWTPGFTKTYDCKLLVWYEVHETMESAILREKQLKGGSRTKKLTLIETMNPGWIDLYDSLFAWSRKAGLLRRYAPRNDDRNVTAPDTPS